MDFDIEAYASACSAYCGEDPPLRWLELATLLTARKDRGWHFKVQQGEPMWGFGLGGAALLVANVDLESRRFHLFEYSADRDHFFDEIEALAAVLDHHERANRGLTSLQKEYIAHDTGTVEMLGDLQRELAQQDAAMDG